MSCRLSTVNFLSLKYCNRWLAPTYQVSVLVGGSQAVAERKEEVDKAEVDKAEVVGSQAVVLNLQEAVVSQPLVELVRNQVAEDKEAEALVRDVLVERARVVVWAQWGGPVPQREAAWE